MFGKTLDDENKYGRPRDWNVDLIPKFFMAGGKLTCFKVQMKETFLPLFSSEEDFHCPDFGSSWAGNVLTRLGLSSLTTKELNPLTGQFFREI